MRTLIIQHDDNTGPGVMRDAIEAAGEAFSYSKASEHKFKGVKKAVKLYRVRREPRKGRKEKKSEATAESA